MTFEDPIWLYLSPVLVFATTGLLALGFRQRNQLLARFAAARLLEQLTEKASLRRSLVKAALVVLAVAAISLALARPQYGVEWSQQKARGIDIVFALDSSKSMLATDLPPTRLERAKLAILDLVARLESDRIGLVAFAGQAFLQTPPTLDYAAFRESLDATDPSMLSRGGSDLGRALKEAAEAFPGENNVKVVLLLTDGEDLGGRALEAAEQAAKDGIQVFAIGVGTSEGEYLRIRNADGIEEFIRDRQGQPVRSQLDEATLRQIAQLTGGRYTRLSDGALDQLYDSVLATLPREERESELKEVKIERFQWLLSAAICCLIAESIIRRRGSGRSATLLPLLAALLNPALLNPADSGSGVAKQATALVPAGLHLLATGGGTDEPTIDAEALAFEAMQNGDYAEALQHYETAIRETADRERQRDALYNMGQAQHQIARQTYEGGKLEQALEEMQRAEDYFKSAAEIDPDDRTTLEDAGKTTRIREQIEKLLRQQQEQEQDSQQSENQSDEQNGQDGSQEQSPSPGDESEQESQQDQQSEQGESSDPGEPGQENQSAPSEGDGDAQDSASPSGDKGQGEDGAPDETAPENESGRSAEDTSGQQSPAPGDASGEETESSNNGANEAPERRSGEAPQATDEESQAVPEVPGDAASGKPGEDEATGTATGPGTPGSEGTEIRGMRVEEAQDLLDSLRGSEEILPFTPPGPGRGRPLQDW